MLRPKFYGTLSGKDFSLDRPDEFKQYLSKLSYKTVNTRIELTIKRVKKYRSVQQNSYYWVCLNFIANEVGYEGADEVNGLHEYFKSQFLVDYSKQIPIIKSTTELSTMEFMDYMTKIGRKVEEMGIVLPSPNNYINE